MSLAPLFAAYVVGSAPFALLVSRVFALPDPRSYGSGNAGATNVARSGNRTAAIITLFADAGKGAVAIAFAVWLESSAAVVAAAGVAAVVGHVFPLFSRFRGGRGVATAFGVFLCWQPLLGVALLTLWAAVFAVFRRSSVASLAAVFAAVPLFFSYAPPQQAVAAAVIAALVVFRHRDNIRRLWRRAEPDFGGGPRP